MNLIISPAHANANTFFGSEVMPFLPIVLLIGVFYFLLLRPQQKKMQQQKEMLSNLRRGDRVVTNGGLMGTISRIQNEHEVEVEIASGVRVMVARAMIADCLAKTEPVKETVARASVEQSEKKAPVKGTKKAVAKPVPQAATKTSTVKTKKASPSKPKKK